MCLSHWMKYIIPRHYSKRGTYWDPPNYLNAVPAHLSLYPLLLTHAHIVCIHVQNSNTLYIRYIRFNTYREKHDIENIIMFTCNDDDDDDVVLPVLDGNMEFSRWIAFELCSRQVRHSLFIRSFAYCTIVVGHRVCGFPCAFIFLPYTYITVFLIRFSSPPLVCRRGRIFVLIIMWFDRFRGDLL